MESWAARPAAGALAAACLLAACGGGSGSSDAAADRAARRDFTRRLDAICLRADRIGAESSRRLARSRRKAGNDGKAIAAGIAKTVDDLEPRIRAVEADLRRLHPPRSERPFYARYLTLSEDIGDAFSATGVAAEAVDPQGYVESGRRLVTLTQQRAGLASRHGGFEHCGTSTS
jgi:hypothetical protein